MKYDGVTGNIFGDLAITGIFCGLAAISYSGYGEVNLPAPLKMVSQEGSQLTVAFVNTGNRINLMATPEVLSNMLVGRCYDIQTRRVPIVSVNQSPFLAVSSKNVLC